jgi:hypothetical protein
VPCCPKCDIWPATPRYRRDLLEITIRLRDKSYAIAFENAGQALVRTLGCAMTEKSGDGGWKSA